MNNKIIFTILITGFLSSAIWLGFSSSSGPDYTSKQELNDLKAELKELKSMLAKNAKGELAINKINQELEQTNTQLKKIKSQQQQLAAQTGSQQDISFVAEVNENIDDTQTEEQIALQEKVILEEEALQIEATVDRLKTEFEQEDIDEKWGPEIEQNLSDNFAKNAPEGSALLETDCRSTFCRITIANNADTDFNPREVLGELFTSSEGFFNSTVDSNGKKVTELYVSRNGYNLPAANPEDSMGF